MTGSMPGYAALGQGLYTSSGQVPSSTGSRAYPVDLGPAMPPPGPDTNFQCLPLLALLSAGLLPPRRRRRVPLPADTARRCELGNRGGVHLPTVARRLRGDGAVVPVCHSALRGAPVVDRERSTDQAQSGGERRTTSRQENLLAQKAPPAGRQLALSLSCSCKSEKVCGRKHASRGRDRALLSGRGWDWRWG